MKLLHHPDVLCQSRQFPSPFAILSAWWKVPYMINEWKTLGALSVTRSSIGTRNSLNEVMVHSTVLKGSACLLKNNISSVSPGHECSVLVTLGGYQPSPNLLWFWLLLWQKIKKELVKCRQMNNFTDRKDFEFKNTNDSDIEPHYLLFKTVDCDFMKL